MKGKCTCGEVEYRLTEKPLFVHACHCRWCQRETGSAFVLNALIETRHVHLTSGMPKLVPTPSESGKGQEIHRCPGCGVALWSVYSGAGPEFRFVRVGTLEEPDLCPPDIHIFTESKQPWLTLSKDVPVMARYYDREDYWPQDSLARWRAVREEG